MPRPPQATSSASERDYSIDLMRGLFILSMAIGHFGGAPRALGFRFLGFVNGAQGFVFMSGFVSGMVYGKLLRTRGASAVRTRVFDRLWLLLRHIWFLVTLAAILTLVFHERTGFVMPSWRPLLDSPLSSWLLGLVLLYQPPLVDVLGMYFVFLALVPFALKQLSLGRWRSYLLLVGIVYVVSQFVGVHTFWADSHMYLCEWNLGSWQTLFFLGLLFGSPFEKPSLSWLRGSTPVIVGGVLCMLLFAMAHPSWIPGIGEQGVLMLQRLDSTWAEKMNMAPLNLLNFLLLAFLFSRCHGWIRPRVGARNILAILGSRSLDVFTFHLAIVFVLSPFRSAISPVAAKGVLVLCVASLWIPAVVARYRRHALGQAVGRARSEGQNSFDRMADGQRSCDAATGAALSLDRVEERA